MPGEFIDVGTVLRAVEVGERFSSARPGHNPDHPLMSGGVIESYSSFRTKHDAPVFGRGRYALCDAGQVTAIGPPFDPVAPLMGAGEKM